jgi:hypothetical protein
MSEREQELAERHAELRLQCALQRRAVAAEVDAMQARLSSVDRFAILARSAVLQPRVLMAGIFALVAFGRFRALNTVSRAFLLFTAARRLWRVVKTVL